MRLASLLIILSSSILISGCKKPVNPNAWLCTLIVKNNNGDNITEPFAFCVNSQTKEERDVSLSDMHKWVTSDPQSYETFRQWYKKQCR
jgi:hypothetical protein